MLGKLTSGLRQSVTDKVAIVTGSAQGIGLATARLLAARGARVVLCDVATDRLEQAVNALRKQGHDVIGRSCDISDADACQQLVDVAIELFGRVDILINNAGISIVAPFAECLPDACRRVVDVNLLGSIYMSLAALPALQQSRGHLVFVASVSGVRAIPTGSLYSATKAAIRSFAESIRVELRPTGVHVGVVSPGFTTSDETKTVMRGDGTPRPIDRPPHDTPEGVARAIVTLIERRQREKILTPLGHLTATLQRMSPTLLDRILERRALKN